MSEASNSERDASYMELLWPLVLNRDAIGQLNWATGVLSLDVPHDLWDDIQNAPDEESHRAVTAYTHELVHVLQIGLFGFPYRWATDLFELLRPAVNRLRAAGSDQDFGPVLDAINRGESALLPDEVVKLSSHYAQLDEPTQIGLTTRSILESHAHFVQRRANYEIASVADWAPHLNDAPGPEYRAAFDVLELAVGESDAFKWFPLICAVAMCTINPAAAFNKIALALAVDASWLPPEPSSDSSLQAQRDLADIISDSLIGSAQEVAMKRPDNDTLHLRIVSALNEAARVGKFDPIRACASPHEEFDRALPYLQVPMFLRPAQPQGFALRLPPDMEQDEMLVRVTVAAVSAQLTRSIEAISRARGDEAIDGLDWLRADRRPAVVRLDIDQVRQSNPWILRMVDPDRNSATNAREMARLWGRVVLMPPVELDPHDDSVLPTLQPVAAYLREMRKLFPAFPILLSWRRGMSGFVDWFGSIEPSAFRGAGVDLRDRSLRLAVAEATAAIIRLGEQSAQNPVLAIQLMSLPLLSAEAGSTA